jgi:hypothetical protein
MASANTGSTALPSRWRICIFQIIQITPIIVPPPILADKRSLYQPTREPHGLPVHQICTRYFADPLFKELYMKVSAMIAAAGSLILAVGGLSAAATSAQGPSDAQIAAIVVAANQVDIDAGKLAKSKSTNPDVKEFAQLMITDHSGVNRQATNLVNKVGVLGLVW